MKKSTGFWMGLGTGMVAGAAAVCMMPAPKRMKTPVGKGIQKVGHTVDRAVDNICSELR